MCAHLLFKEKILEAFHRDEQHYGVSSDAHLLQFIEFIDRFMAGTRAPNRNAEKLI